MFFYNKRIVKKSIRCYTFNSDDIMKIINTLKAKNLASGYLYFYVHLITEVASFYYLSKVTNGARFIWLIPFIYDALAFVPQGIIGYINDKIPKLNMGLIGVILFMLAYILYIIKLPYIFLVLIIVSLANAFLHVSGAEVTLRSSNGKLSHPAIFVGGGSFGVIAGRLLATTSISPWLIVFLVLTMIPFILLAEGYTKKDKYCLYDCASKKINPYLIIMLATFVVIIRGYIGYGIPTSWNKTTLQTVLLFSTMGLGKCLGGILADAYGVKRIGIISALLAIPFLLFGDNLMMVSLIGVMFFSMTMSITLALIVSVLKDKPGLAFGFTTVGLFLGTVPIFFISITNKVLNASMIVVASIICALIFNIIIKEEKVHS